MRHLFVKIPAVFLFCCCISVCAQTTDSTVANYTDSLAFLEPTPKLKVEADGKIWLWENADQSNDILSVSFTLPINPEFLPRFEKDAFKFNPYNTPARDFLSHSEYLKNESEYLRSSEAARNSNFLRLPMQDVASTLIDLFKREKKVTVKDVPRGLVLSETEMNMLNVVWKKPDISPTDWYMAITDQSGFPGTYRTFQQILDGFEARGLVKKRTITLGFLDKLKGGEERYTAIFSSKILKMAFADAFSTSDALSKGSYHFQLQRMLAFLEDIPSLLDSNISRQ
ncbi:MAG: hypothetical protein AAFP70_07825 [Calditrichota bacterium]